MYRRALRQRKEVTCVTQETDVPAEQEKTFDEEPEVLGDNTRDEDEKTLEALVIGVGDDIVESLQETSNKRKKRKKKHGEATREKPNPVWEDDEDRQETITVAKKKKVANIHMAEKEISTQTYKEHLKKEFEKVAGNPAWAKLKWQREEDEEDDVSDDEDILRRTGNYLTQSEFLPKEMIQMKRCTDGNKDSPSQGKIKSTEFHPSSQVLLTAGLDQRLCLFQVDGKHNPKIQSLFMKRFPIHTAHFTTDGTEVIMGSRYKFFHSYDMIAGKVSMIPQIKGLEENSMKQFEMSPDGKTIAFLGSYGHIHLLSTQSKEWISSMKMNGSVEALCFSRDGSTMYSTGDDADIYVWDMNTRQCTHRFADDGCIKGTSIATSFNGNYLATGSYSGVVNIYNTATLSSSTRPKPLKAVMNLTTPCTSLRFHPSTEVLAAMSNYADKAMKLIHFPSLSVFSNFPDKSDKLRIPVSMDFSPNGGYMALGNHRGQALLYRVKHYGNY